MFSDAVAHELFKTAAEVAEVEDESVAESSRRKKRALIGAGLTAAALGGLALGAYQLSKPVETLGADIDKSILPQERGAMATIGDTAKSTAGIVAGPAGAGAAGAVGGAIFSRYAMPFGPKSNDIGNLANRLVQDGSEPQQHSKVREFFRGMVPFVGDSQTDAANSIRRQLSSDVTADPAKLSNRLSAILRDMGAGAPSSGALGSKLKLVDIANRPIPGGTVADKAVKNLEAAIGAAAKSGKTELSQPKMTSLLNSLSASNMANSPGSVLTAAGPTKPHSLQSVVGKFNELLSLHDASEAARNRLLNGTYKTPDARAVDMRIAAQGELARTILAEIGEGTGADSKDKGGGKNEKPSEAAAAREAKRNAAILRGAKAIRTVTNEVSGSKATRNMVPRMLGGGTMGAFLGSAPHILNAMFPGE